MTPTVACSHCGALNGADFGKCIRCERSLGRAEPADKAVRRAVAPRRRGTATGPGSEPLLGRWPAEALPAAKLMLLANALVFFVHVSTAFARDPSLGTLFTGGHPLEALLYGAFNYQILLYEPWRLLSANFVHFGAMHFGMNMFGLIYLARLLEPALGSIRFILLYVISGVVGFAVSEGWMMLFPAVSITAGASASLFGVMGGILGFLWRHRDPRWKAWLGQAVVFSLVFGIALRANNAAHVGGLIAGAVLGALMAPGAPRPSRAWQRWLAALCVLACGGSLIAARMSPINQQATELLEQNRLETAP